MSKLDMRIVFRSPAELCNFVSIEITPSRLVKNLGVEEAARYIHFWCRDSRIVALAPDQSEQDVYTWTLPYLRSL